MKRQHDRPGVQRTGPLGIDPLDQYLEELHDCSLLTGPQELELARTIEAGEIAHWDALLSHPPVLPSVAQAVEKHMPRPAELDALLRHSGAKARTTSPGWKRARQQAAQALRGADDARSALSDVDQKVRTEWAGKRGMKRYFDRVERARATHLRAKNQLVTSNLRLVVAMARRYRQKLMPLADLIQEGNLGLLRAAERFDHRRGLRFSTYAGWWIRHAFNRGLSDRGRLVRVPVHTLDDIQRIAQASHALRSQTGREPDAAELAEETGLSPDRVQPLSQMETRMPLSLDRTLGSDSDTTGLDMLASDTAPAGDLLDSANWQQEAAQLLEHLPSIEAAVLRYRFGFEGGDELTLREIGEKYNLSRERIRQLQEQALLRLRAELAKRRTAFESDERAA